MKEKLLQLIAEAIGAKLDTCDDGYVICTGKTEFIFDLDGNFEKEQVHAGYVLKATTEINA